MTEADWLTGWFYRRMYNTVRDRATTRQVRLYMVACCRLKAAEFFDPRILRTLETAERCADDPQTEVVVNAIGNELVTASRRPLPPYRSTGCHRPRVTPPIAALARLPSTPGSTLRSASSGVLCFSHGPSPGRAGCRLRIRPDPQSAAHPPSSPHVRDQPGKPPAVRPGEWCADRSE